MDRRISSGFEADRGVSKVVGTILMVAIVVLLATAVVTMTGTFGEELGGPLPETAMNVEQHEAGLLVTPEHIGQEVTVVVNGVDILTYDGGDAGESRLLPVAPGDTVQVVAEEDDRSILIHRQIEPNEARKFVAFYSFEEGSGAHLEDRSWQSNHGELEAYGGNTNRENWVTDDVGGTGLDFDHANDEFVHVPDLDTAEEVEEFTVAVKYRIDGPKPSGTIQQLVEHHHGPTSFEWYLETEGYSSGDYNVHSKVGEDGGPGGDIIGPNTSPGDVNVAVMTYDGETMRYYQDGSLVGTESESRTIKMGELNIGADAPSANHQYLDGRIYQLRLYHTEFAEEDAEILSKIMESDVSSS